MDLGGYKNEDGWGDYDDCEEFWICFGDKYNIRLILIWMENYMCYLNDRYVDWNILM